MIRIAVTGGIACGKSLAASFFEKEGVPVCDADIMAHDIMASSSHVKDALVEAFGKDIVSSTGTVDRQRLAIKVFGQKDQLERLNAIVHPPVRTAIENWLVCREREGTLVSVVVIPLLFEAGMTSGWDAIVCVSSPEGLQRERMKARGLDEHACNLRLQAQMPTEDKEKRSDYVIRNDKDPGNLSAEVRRVLKAIKER